MSHVLMVIFIVFITVVNIKVLHSNKDYHIADLIIFCVKILAFLIVVMMVVQAFMTLGGK